MFLLFTAGICWCGGRFDYKYSGSSFAVVPVVADSIIASINLRRLQSVNEILRWLSFGDSTQQKLD